jgi:two-component system sensor histidine kinase/response regulator
MTTPTKILLVDDDSVDREAVRRALKASGLIYELVEAADGASGLKAAKAGTFDCVLLDFRLPDVDTFELLTTLIAPEGGNQAVIMLTGESDQDIALRLMRAGALDYLTKAETTPSILARAIRYAKARRAFVAELKTARQEAEEKSRALDNLNRQKTLLLSIIAHDLRNPFQVLLGLSQTLSHAVAIKDPASIERRAQGIGEAAKQAHSLMESLFSWANLQMDSATVDLAEVDLAGVASEALASCLEPAADKGIKLTAACDGLVVRGHRDMLAAVLRNLVGNAVKFTLPGGSVRISAVTRGSDVEINVTDTGVGMSPEKLADLFKLDRRTTTAGTAGERGSGLGLLLCRDLVERQGGELSVVSEVGRGTTFRFALAHG